MQGDYIFNSHFDFEQTALELFRWQAKENTVYKNYLHYLNIEAGAVQSIAQIPFLPIRLFKSQRVVTGLKKVEIVFTSSGTTGNISSEHHVTDVRLYEQSFTKAFELFYGDISGYCIVALLPSYLERGGSSLVYMCEKLIEQSQHQHSGFYLHEYEKLASVLQKLEAQNQKTILIGVTYALLDFAEEFPMPLHYTMMMETGGMKGKREEMIKSHVHALLQQAFGLKQIHSEYGMTELLSQAYSTGHGIYRCPPWMKVLTRDTDDPFSILPEGKSGGINIIDLANRNSCAFIATQDLGKIHPNGSFEIIGRFDDAEIRGCNLMVE
jgi:Acyl-protein synthetase, LuxE